jgi:hypothetical protein
VIFKIGPSRSRRISVISGKIAWFFLTLLLPKTKVFLRVGLGRIVVPVLVLLYRAELAREGSEETPRIAKPPVLGLTFHFWIGSNYGITLGMRSSDFTRWWSKSDFKWIVTDYFQMDWSDSMLQYQWTVFTSAFTLPKAEDPNPSHRYRVTHHLFPFLPPHPPMRHATVSLTSSVATPSSPVEVAPYCLVVLPPLSVHRHPRAPLPQL